MNKNIHLILHKYGVGKFALLANTILDRMDANQRVVYVSGEPYFSDIYLALAIQSVLRKGLTSYTESEILNGTRKNDRALLDLLHNEIKGIEESNQFSRAYSGDMTLSLQCTVGYPTFNLIEQDPSSCLIFGNTVYPNDRGEEEKAFEELFRLLLMQGSLHEVLFFKQMHTELTEQVCTEYAFRLKGKVGVRLASVGTLQQAE